MTENKLITVNYSEKADKDLQKIDKKQASRIVNKIALYMKIDILQKFDNFYTVRPQTEGSLR